MRWILILFCGLAVLGAAALEAKAPALAPICVKGVDSEGGQWDLQIDRGTLAVTGTWDRSAAGCPVYNVTGRLIGNRFDVQATQAVDPGCDRKIDFFATYDRRGVVRGYWIGDQSGLVLWTGRFRRC